MAKFNGTANDLQDVRKMTGDLSGDETNYPNVKAVEQSKQEAITESKEYTDTKVDEIPKHVTSFGGGEVGENAIADLGGAVGFVANTVDGGAVGFVATTENGGAVGNLAQSKNGFAGGERAIADGVDNIQLGEGTNTKEKTLQVYDYTLMNADGTIPPERLPEPDYTALTNKPKINGVEVVGDKTSVDLGVASAIKNTVSGAVIAVNDVSDIEHNVEVKCSSDTITDLTQARLSVGGKNILPQEALQKENWGKEGVRLIFELGEITKDFNFSAKAISPIYFSVQGADSDGVWSSEKGYYLFGNNTGFKEATIKVAQGRKYRLWLDRESSFDKIKDIQIEIGSQFTGYETPNQIQYTPLADGTVPNVKSVSPNMTMYADTDGVNLTTTYNADTKRYIDNKFTQLQQAILSTGGNI